MGITNIDDLLKSKAFLGRFFFAPSTLPVSFVLDGKPIFGIPSDWMPTSQRRLIDSNIIERVFEGTDRGSGLHIRVECTEYRDHPVIEWMACFTNRGRQPTPVIREILALNGTFNGSSPILVHCNGDFYGEDGYKPQQTPLHSGVELSFSPNGGRPCDGAFPYYRLLFDDGGHSIAIGWPAQWAARFIRRVDGVQVLAGQELTNLRLMPGESIRTPRMTVLSWAGDGSRATNLWRRWYLTHILPKPDGQPMKPLLACCGTDEGEEFTGATEENQLRFIDKFKDLGIDFDVWWIDAGWYSCFNAEHIRKWTRTGTWEIDIERFPNGLKPISDRANERGADLLVWFEPERVQSGTKLDVEHPEWLLRTPESDNALLNLGNPECRQWLTDHVCQLIQDNCIKIYRQDFNFPPLEHWRKNESEERQGLNENLHVQGYLQFWDDLLARNSGLWIDSCASGGRRNDLETMRRSVPLHYTDFGYGDHPVKLAFQRTLYEWIPYFKEFTLSWDIGGTESFSVGYDGGSGGPTAIHKIRERFDPRIDSYSYHCAMAPMLFASLDIRRDDYDFGLAGKMIAIWRRASSLLLYGDYYPHTPFHRSDREWVVRQFDNPETGTGFVQGIRLPESVEESMIIHPTGIRPDLMYFLENVESGDTREVVGEHLIRDGLAFALPARSGAIWFYQSASHPTIRRDRQTTVSSMQR